MSNMSYCRHENTANDLADVVECWEDFDSATANQFELSGRKRIIELAREIVEMTEGEDLS
jgi:hypothetical protein